MLIIFAICKGIDSVMGTSEFQGSTNTNWNIQKNYIHQYANSNAAIAIGKAQFAAVDYNGKMEVRTTSDDDIIGFVFGFQDIQNFYVVYARKASYNLPWRLVKVHSTNLASLDSGMKHISKTERKDFSL